MTYFRKHRYGFAIAFLFLTAIGLRLFYAITEDFLHDWDERFHALVALNMMDRPFEPMLIRSPLVPYDPNLWCCNHIWLHKQPLFLWQMALSMKIFGVSEWALRLPGVLMGSIMILFSARISILLTGNRTIAFFSALLLCFSNFHLELISGIEGMDHNDVALGFYVLASVWTYAEYLRTGKWYWAVLTGIFAGCAVLNKWLVGLFVYLCWGIHWLVEWYRNGKMDLRQAGHFILSLFFCLLVFLPWQIYILYRWPDLAGFEYEFNRKHITVALEGHSGSVWYYVDSFTDFFGAWLGWLIVPGIVLYFYRNYINRRLFISLLCGLLFVFCFFSFIVKTKVQSHFFFIVPICMIMISVTAYELVLRYKRWYFSMVVAALFVFLSFKPKWFNDYFSGRFTERENSRHNAALMRSIGPELKDVDLVMNLNPFENIEFMFYQNRVTAYDYPLSPEQLSLMKKKKIRIGVFNLRGRPIPDYLARYPYLKFLKGELY